MPYFKVKLTSFEVTRSFRSHFYIYLVVSSLYTSVLYHLLIASLYASRYSTLVVASSMHRYTSSLYAGRYSTLVVSSSLHRYSLYAGRYSTLVVASSMHIRYRLFSGDFPSHIQVYTLVVASLHWSSSNVMIHLECENLQRVWNNDIAIYRSGVKVQTILHRKHKRSKSL